MAVAIAAPWGTPPSTGDFVDGAAVRRLAPRVWMLRRPGLHIHDEHLDRKLPEPFRPGALVFPSVHRSDSGIRCLTVHPLGNFGARPGFGGEPLRLVPTRPRLMVSALRRLHELGAPAGLSVAYEATHHGPVLDQPAFFVEIAESVPAETRDRIVQPVATAIVDLTEDAADRVVVGIGGGHYAPHFSEVALRRHWAFGHIVPRHALAGLGPELEKQVWKGTPNAEGFLFQRAADLARGGWLRLGPRLSEGESPALTRARGESGGPTRSRRDASPVSGT